MQTTEVEDIHTTVYLHLYEMNLRIAKTIFGRVTPILKYISSQDAHAEMIQMAQTKQLGSYYDRLQRGAV